MAKEKGRIEDTVKDIISTGIDMRPRTVDAKAATDHIVKPNNFDGLYVVGTTGSITLGLSTGNNTLAHKLGRTPEGFIVVYKDADSNIYKGTNWNDYSCDLWVSANVNAKVIIF